MTLSEPKGSIYAGAKANDLRINASVFCNDLHWNEHFEIPVYRAEESVNVMVKLDTI